MVLIKSKGRYYGFSDDCDIIVRNFGAVGNILDAMNDSSKAMKDVNNALTLQTLREGGLKEIRDGNVLTGAQLYWNGLPQGVQTAAKATAIGIPALYVGNKILKAVTNKDKKKK